jgi:transcriptional regulator with XRE-family HTH domain
MSETPEQTLRRLRLEAKIPLKELAAALGIVPQYLHDIENGRRRLSDNRALLLPASIRVPVVEAIKAELLKRIERLSEIKNELGDG